jgi:hypothetical protein
MMAMRKALSVMIIDGQGGKLGRQLCEGIKAALPQAEITAVGTNAAATATMMKGGADFGASGENAVVVGCRTADMIVGPIGIVIADALLGEITPAMAVAVGQSPAYKVLVPVNRCNNYIVGVPDKSMAALIGGAVATVRELAEKR